MGLNACNPPSSYKRESFMSKMLILVHLLIASMESFIEEKFMHTHTPLAFTFQAQILGDDGAWSCASLQLFKALFPPPCKPSQASHARRKNSLFFFSCDFLLDLSINHAWAFINLAQLHDARRIGIIMVPYLYFHFIFLFQALMESLGPFSHFAPKIHMKHP